MRKKCKNKSVLNQL